MKTSVAMCTFNGASFLEAQLRSIAAQSEPPSELVVCDDASTDGSVDLLRRFASTAPFPLRLQVNSERLGSTRNFEQAIRLCEGEVIFLADQDDVWHPEKIARLSRLFDADARLACAFSDARLVDAEGREIAPSLWGHIAFTSAERRRFERGGAFEILIVHNVVTGATMAFRRAYLSAFLPLPTEHQMIHDRWIALVASAAGPIRFAEEPLVDYRQHERQQIGSGDPVGGVQQWIDTARDTDEGTYALWAAQLRLFEQRLSTLDGVDPGRVALLRSRIEHLAVRASLPHDRLRRTAAVLREIATLRYHRHSNHIWSIAKDLFWKPNRG